MYGIQQYCAIIISPLYFYAGDFSIVKEKAPQLLSKAVESCLSMPELSIQTPDSAGMKLQFQSWASHIISNHEFASKLVDLLLKRIFSTKVLQAKSLGTRFENVWSSFHQLASSSELHSLWLQGLSNPP